MADRRREGFEVLDDHGRTLCGHWKDEDAPEEFRAARGRIYGLPDGEYWLITVRADRVYLRRIEADVEKTIFAPATHACRFSSFVLSADTRKAVADLRRSLLTGLKVPKPIRGFYLRLVV